MWRLEGGERVGGSSVYLSLLRPILSSPGKARTALWPLGAWCWRELGVLALAPGEVTRGGACGQGAVIGLLRDGTRRKLQAKHCT